MISHAQWIACERFESPIIRRIFSVDTFISAELFITGLGYFTPYLNGKPVTDCRFMPAQTDYHPRDTAKFNYPIHDRMHYRVNYLRFDVSRMLVFGENTLHILLGNGWYRQTVRKAEGDMCYGTALKARYALHIHTENGSYVIASDGSEQYGRSSVLESNLFRGEVIDLRQTVEFNERVQVVEMDTPLFLQECPPDRIVEVIHPVLVCRQGDSCIYDNGENVTGVVVVTTDSPRSGEVRLTFSENLNGEGGDLDTASTGIDQLQEDRFFHDGGMHEFVPQFVFHCFRYFKIIGDFRSVKTLVIHTDVPSVSEFECDHSALNWLYHAFRRTFLNNLHGAVPSDCPHRERLGYTGDGQLTAEAAMYCFDMSKAYRKWILDIFDGQGESGHIQHTAPFQGGGGGPACWGGAAVILPYQYYRFYGDKAFLEEQYPKMVRWIDYMRTRCEGGLVVREEDGGWCLGDWGSATQPSINPAYVNTAFFAHLLNMAAELAGILGQTDDVEDFRRYCEDAKQAVQGHFFDPETGDYCENIQFANIFALIVGLGDHRTIEHLCLAVDECGNTLDIGIVAMDLLIWYFFRIGEQDRAVRAIELLTAQMRGGGATTVWEYPYQQDISNCHHMFCGMVRSIFSELLGIRLALDGSVTFAPEQKLPFGINYVRGSTVLRGKTIVSEFRKEQGGIVVTQYVENNYT